MPVVLPKKPQKTSLRAPPADHTTGRANDSSRPSYRSLLGVSTCTALDARLAGEAHKVRAKIPARTMSGDCTLSFAGDRALSFAKG
jgi:hypothetical protein